MANAQDRVHFEYTLDCCLEEGRDAVAQVNFTSHMLGICSDKQEWLHLSVCNDKYRGPEQTKFQSSQIALRSCFFSACQMEGLVLVLLQVTAKALSIQWEQVGTC